jgi:predicted amidohydrolase YtcJ
MRQLWLGCALALVLAACSEEAPVPAVGEDVTLYPAANIITMDDMQAEAEMVAVADGRIVAVGSDDELSGAYPAATRDEMFVDKTLVPGLIDPHIHMALSSLQYATKLTPPWEMATPEGVVQGLPDRAAFLAALRGLVTDHEGDGPLIVFGYHNLVHGDLVRADLDAITTDIPLIIWHYSSHDFYLNENAIEWAGVTADLHGQFEGIDLGADGEPTGRVYEDAIPYLLQKMGPILLAPDRIARGLEGFSDLLRSGGVTTVADLGYGIFGRALENANITNNWISYQQAGYRLYLVPEHRAFRAEFGAGAPEAVTKMLAGEIATPAPVLPQVKFFTDAAFYSQTMRVSPPGYLAGQSKGTEGLWVLPPNEIAATIMPYWEAGFDVRIHSNGDAAQTASLNALETLRETSQTQRFVFEHAGLFSPEQVGRAGALGAGISAASHYVYFLGEAYQAPLGPERGSWILPLNSLSQAGVPVTLHSDAPLAPPLPLRAASVHMTRATREGGVLNVEERLSAREALEAITVDAAYALGLENEIGAIKPGLLADFTVLEANPLETPGADWGEIGIWGVVLGGEKRALE